MSAIIVWATYRERELGGRPFQKQVSHFGLAAIHACVGYAADRASTSAVLGRSYKVPEDSTDFLR